MSHDQRSLAKTYVLQQQLSVTYVTLPKGSNLQVSHDQHSSAKTYALQKELSVTAQLLS